MELVTVDYEWLRVMIHRDNLQVIRVGSSRDAQFGRHGESEPGPGLGKARATFLRKRAPNPAGIKAFLTTTMHKVRLSSSRRSSTK